MNIEKIKGIAAEYGLVLAETEAEKQAYEELGYQKLDFEIEKILPELYVAYEPNLTFYGNRENNLLKADKKAFKYAA